MGTVGPNTVSISGGCPERGTVTRASRGRCPDFRGALSFDLLQRVAAILTVTSKTMQHIANGTEFSDREADYANLNGVVRSCIPRYEERMTDLSW